MSEFAVQKLAHDRWLTGRTIGQAVEKLSGEPDETEIAMRHDGRTLGTATLGSLRDALRRGIKLDGNVLE